MGFYAGCGSSPEPWVSKCATDPITISFADSFSSSGVIPGRPNLGFHLIHDRRRVRLLKQKSCALRNQIFRGCTSSEVADRHR